MLIKYYKEAMEVLKNFKIATTLRTKYSAVQRSKRAISCVFSTEIHFFHAIRHVYRSVWPAREAKPRFDAALVRSAHDCETRFLVLFNLVPRAFQLLTAHAQRKQRALKRTGSKSPQIADIQITGGYMEINVQIFEKYP